MIAEAIAANSTANLGQDDAGATTIIGNRTEGALLRWLREERGQDYAAARAASAIVSQVPFSTERKYMATRVTALRGRKTRVTALRGRKTRVTALCGRKTRVGPGVHPPQGRAGAGAGRLR